MAFSDILKYLRGEKGVTQKELAKACNLSPQCICNLEQGTRNPTGSTVAVLATFFGVSADYLLELENDYGAKVVEPMAEKYTAEERQLIEDYRQLNHYKQELIKNNIKAMLPAEAERAQRKLNG